jgi:hypothetical protein
MEEVESNKGRKPSYEYERALFGDSVGVEVTVVILQSTLRC